MEDDTLLRAYPDIPDSTRSMPWDGPHKRILFESEDADSTASRGMLWDGPHKRILFESEDPDSTVSGSDTQEARPGWPRRT